MTDPKPPSAKGPLFRIPIIWVIQTADTGRL
jgi:hypothetical protein